jgi:hypothetical protein
MITPIDVLDTAIKIGLGALISGLAAYWVAKLNHDREREKLRAQRRRELLEAVAEQVEVFSQAVLHHWAFVINWVTFTPPNEQMSDETRNELRKIQSELSAAFKEITSAEAKLLLLGEVPCQKLLRAYGEEVTIYRIESVSKRVFTEESLREGREKMMEKREAFFTELSNAYRGI